MIKVQNICKSYGQKIALDNFSFIVNKGSVLGLLGPNGSGKSTLLQILTGTLNASWGEVKICGSNVGADTKAAVSFLPEENQFYEWMRVKEAVQFYKDSFTDFDCEKFNGLKSEIGFDDMAVIRKMSKGKLQQFRIEIALSRRAKVYLLDEPLGAIDTLARQLIIHLISSVISKDTCMIIASHLINETERLFDNVLFIKKGKAVLFDECDKLRQSYNSSVENIYKEVMQNA